MSDPARRQFQLNPNAQSFVPTFPPPSHQPFFGNPGPSGFIASPSFSNPPPPLFTGNRPRLNFEGPQSHRRGGGRRGTQRSGRNRGAYGRQGNRQTQTTGVSGNPESEESLRVRLSDQLESETYECCVCCDVIQTSHWTWSCPLCYHVFHLRCIKKWASKSTNQEGLWRCPGCQNLNQTYPTEYLCFCGKVPNPRYRRGDAIPHACDNACRKAREGGCPHKCTLPCHPGPCPACPKTVTASCECGNSQRTVRCGSAAVFKCDRECGRLLCCELHECKTICHSGGCEPCSELVAQKCFCGKSDRSVKCTVESLSKSHFSCGQPCGATLSCGHHTCNRICHEGPCPKMCDRDPGVLNRCPCGRTDLKDLVDESRNSCTDPVPVCGNACGKELGCGPEGRRHTCARSCHDGDCPQCPESTVLKCRCGGSSTPVPCAKIKEFTEENPLLCERRCKKQKSCKQHKCANVCCVDRDHICMQICGRPLACGVHNCDQLCHRGKCNPCLQASFTELYCECGTSVVEPPVPCGAKRPSCEMPCSRDHPCGHPVSHKCHSESECPPCTHLTKKWCYGKHELRANIPCYLEDVSCGKPCGRRLSCGTHFCMRPCHPGDCMKEGERCRYSCKIERTECGHPCGSLCHEGPCPETACKATVLVTCRCGTQKGETTCTELTKQWARQLATKAMTGGQTTQESKTGGIRILQRQESTEKFKCLPCTEECARFERNRRMAEALGVNDPDLVGLKEPTYTDFLKSFAAENRQFVLSVEKSLIELVQSADEKKGPGGTSKTHVFQPMGRDQRRAIHEYAGYFLVETVSYDSEPQRNVVAYAKKGRSFVPKLLLSSVACQNMSAKTATKLAPPPAQNASISQSGENMNQESLLQSLYSAPGVVKR